MTDIKELLSQLHSDLAKDLIIKIKGGEATAADLRVAKEFLKDNDITALSTPGSDLEKLNLSLPEFEENEETAH